MLGNGIEGIHPEEGLPEELFLEISGLVPIPNVDLFILDEAGRLLLTRRDDPYFGKGWHLPGGCIRFKETMLERVQKTALSELGTTVRVEEAPLAIRDVIIRGVRKDLTNQNMRAHQLAVLFRCYADDTEHIEQMLENGEADWFTEIPGDILPVHDVYRDIFEKYDLVRD